MMITRIVLITAWAFMLFGCLGQDRLPEDSGSLHEGDDVPTVAVTQWTHTMELFMEYPSLVKGKPEKFIIHLTISEDFSPVRQGTIKMTFRHQEGQTFEVVQDELLREGIFTPMVELPFEGAYELILNYMGERVSESFNLQGVRVYASVQDIPGEPESNEQGISFLKEQQWKIDFRVEPVERRVVRSPIQAVGQVLPRRASYAEVSSPVEGILQVEDGQETVTPGRVVKAGQVLATLSPSLGASNSWTGRKLAYEQARREYERAQRLKEQGAISHRDFEQTKNNYLIQKSGYEAHDQTGDSDLYRLNSPISGVIAEVTTLPGQKVEAGQKLMTIVDPSNVWLRVNVFEIDYYRMGTPNGATLTIPGRTSPMHIEGRDFHVLSMGNLLDPDSRTIPVLLEIQNPDDLLKIGQTVQVELYTGDEIPRLCVPQSSIFDDDAKNVVFVQKEGETFEKRSVKTGARYKGWISVLNGLQEGEHVVTDGGYQVKLASTSTAIAHPHAH